MNIQLNNSSGTLPSLIWELCSNTARLPGVIRCTGGFGQRDGLNFGGSGIRAVMKRVTTITEDEEKMHIDYAGDLATEADNTQTGYQYPVSFELAVQITIPNLNAAVHFSRTPHVACVLYPYLTVFLTFIPTISKHPEALAILERPIPWSELVDLTRFHRSSDRRLFISGFMITSNVVNRQRHHLSSFMFGSYILTAYPSCLITRPRKSCITTTKASQGYMAGS